VWFLGRDNGHVVFSFVIVLLYLAAFRRRICSAIFSHPIITDISWMCYSIYLFHFIIIYGVKHFSASLHFGENFWVVLHPAMLPDYSRRAAFLRNILPSDRAPLHGSGMAHEAVAARAGADAFGGAAARILNLTRPESPHQLREVYVITKRAQWRERAHCKHNSKSRL
jgi:hypothetical protein